MRKLYLIIIMVSLSMVTACSDSSSNSNNKDPINGVQADKSDIVDTAIQAGSFTTLVAAVQAAGLVETLKSEGPFTVFAPTDEAFSLLPEGTVAELLKPENQEKLQNILLYHVNAGKVLKAEDIVKLSRIESALGESLSVKVEDGKVFINESLVQLVDIQATNGIIHVIDMVLLP